MRHQKKHGLKLGTDASHTRAMKRSLVCSLFLNDRIKTTETRAKAIRGDVDRVITWAKRGDLHSRRLAIAKLNDKEIVREVFEKAEQGMWADRTCGFTRIYKLGPRRGDNAPMVIMELVTEPVQPKKKGAAAEKASATEVKPVEDETKAKAEETVADAEQAPAKEDATAEAAEPAKDAAPAKDADPEKDAEPAEEPAKA